MDLDLHIPDSIIQAIRLPEDRIPQELLKELALALYSQGFLSFGKARNLAGLEKFEFGRILGQRNIPRHYSRKELEDDLTYARGE